MVHNQDVQIELVFLIYCLAYLNIRQATVYHGQFSRPVCFFFQPKLISVILRPQLYVRNLMRSCCARVSSQAVCIEMLFCLSWLQRAVIWVTADFLVTTSLMVLLWPPSSKRHASHQHAEPSAALSMLSVIVLLYHFVKKSQESSSL